MEGRVSEHGSSSRRDGLIIAQRFNAGLGRCEVLSPEGTADACRTNSVNRPFGTQPLRRSIPAFKRRAILDCPFGTTTLGTQLSAATRLFHSLRTTALRFLITFALLSTSILSRAADVVAYCAQDQVYAETIFHDFEKQTGVRVRAVFDSEAVKTVGLANRLLAERQHPQCDVLWGNEEMRARELATRNVFRESDGWAAFGYRSRRIVINTNHLSLATAPHSLLDFTNAVWRGKVALAYPQFGTTATHFHALRQYWGNDLWDSWCRRLAANNPRLVDGNSVVVNMVAQGEAWLGLTDSDDIAAGQREGLPVLALPMNDETLLIPNTVAVIRGAPHPDSAERLFNYLQKPEVAKQLVDAHALEGISIDKAPVACLKPNWAALLRDLEKTTATLNEIFLR